jgi:hypothetical protein
VKKTKKALKGATVGSITLRLFSALPVEQAGWAVKAWCAYVEDGTEPEDIPAESLGTWVAIKEEADNIVKLSKARSDAGAAGNEKRWKENRKESQTVANGRKVSQRRGEESITHTLTSVLPARDAREAGAAPAPPAPSKGASAPANEPDPYAVLAPGQAAQLEEAMADAPLTCGEALAYALSPTCGLTPQQVLDWALWNAERSWKRDLGGHMHPLDGKGAKRSMIRWRNRQSEIDSAKRRGGLGGGDVTIRGVRVANRGGGLAEKAGF